MARGYMLTQRDRDQLAALLARDKRRVHQIAANTQPFVSYSSEVFLTKATSGIAARSGTTPGSATCPMYRLYQASPPGGAWSIEALLNPDSSAWTQKIFNVHAAAWPGSSTNFIRVHREKISGQWMCDPPPSIGQLYPCYFNADFDRGDSVSAQIGMWTGSAWDYTANTQTVYDSEGKQGPGKSQWRGWVTLAESGRWEIVVLERSPSALWIEFTVKNDFQQSTLNFQVDVTRFWEGPDPGPVVNVENVGPILAGKYVFKGKAGKRGRAQFDRYSLVYRADWIECVDEQISENPAPSYANIPPPFIQPVFNPAIAGLSGSLSQFPGVV